MPLATVAGATVLRAAVDPLIHNQIPYFIYVAAVAVATEWAGVGAGIVCTVLAAFLGNYLFVPPRYELVPHGEDWIAMGLFAAVALGLVAFVGRARRTAQEVVRLHERTSAVLEQMPVGVVVADAEGVIQFRNSTFDRLLGVPSHVGMTLAEFRSATEYTTIRVLDGKELTTDERPLGRALRGETVREEEIHVVTRDGTPRVFSTAAVPLRDDDGRIAGAVLALTDTSERKRIEAELLQREEQLRAATLAAEVGVWSWTPGTSRVSVGANWRQLFGVTPGAEVTFDTWVQALHPDDRERAVATLNQAWQQRREFSSEYRVVCPDGTIRWIVDRGRATCDATGAAVGMAGINLDMTHLKDAEEALRDANRVKDEFLATLSHELRTPLNAIVGWSDMLWRGTLKPPEAKRAAESIYRNARIQTELINDVLDVSRIMSGKVRVELQRVDLSAVLHAALESLRPAAAAKGLSVSTDIPPDASAVSGDPTRLQQVFWNLLSNAVKFTPAGGRLSISSRPVPGAVQVSVTDTGIGIAPDFLPHVFERFRQRDSSSTRTHGGLGLGLAIVKHLVELHGGRVAAESAGEGTGATFTVTLPAAPFQERRLEPGSAGAVSRRVPPVAPVVADLPSLCEVRVLIVDDERDARDLTASVLQHHGASVAVAANAEQALEQLVPFNPDVLLLDLAMPDTDGFALLERIRQMGGHLGTVPAIAFTAYAREADRQRALARGFQAHLAKPVDSYALVRAVSAALRRLDPPSGGTA